MRGAARSTRTRSRGASRCVALALCALCRRRPRASAATRADRRGDASPTPSGRAIQAHRSPSSSTALKAGDARQGVRATRRLASAQQFGTAANFLAMVRTAYGALIAARYTEFLEGAVIDGNVIQPLRLVAPDNSVRVALYTMEKQPDGRLEDRRLRARAVDGAGGVAGPAASVASASAQSLATACLSRTETCAAAPSRPAARA